MTKFADIPIRQNGQDHNIEASWFNIIREKLRAKFDNGSSYTEGETQVLAAGDEVAINPDEQGQILRIQSSGGEVALSATPFGTEDFIGGRTYILLGLSDTDTVTLVNNDAPKGCILNGKATLKRWYKLELIYLASEDRFLEASRNF